MRNSSLVQRISLVASAGIFFSTLLVTGLALARDLQRSVQSERDLLLSYAAVFSSAVAPAVSDDNRSQAIVALTGMSKLQRVTHARIETVNGDTFASVGTDHVLSNRVSDITQAASLGSALSQRLAVRADIRRGGVLQGQLLVVSDANFFRQRLFSGLIQALLIAISLTLLVGTVSVVLLRSAIRPVARLTETIERAVKDQMFAEQVETRRNDEIGRLGQSFNSMMAGLVERDSVIRSQVDTLEDKVEERTRQYRLAKDEADQANAAKSDFLATMSHEIRTPLNGMLVMAELLANGQLPGKQKRYADVIQSSGQGLLAIINDILDLSKVEASKLELESIPIELNDLIENIATLFAGKASEKGLTIGVFVAPETPKKIMGDPTRLGQILTNLLNNAIKFTSTGGVGIFVQPDSDCRSIRFEVIDTGIGIPKDQLGNIFDAFSQADQSTTRKYGGTGLGLSICQRLVEAMNGYIVAASTVGVGSVFSCHLPLITAADAAPVPIGVKRSILLLHDDDFATRLLCMMFLAHGFDVQYHLAASATRRSITGSDYLVGTPANLEIYKSSLGDLSPVAICLQQFGDQAGERALTSGAAEDGLMLPAGPTRVAELCDRLTKNDLAGLKALEFVESSASELRRFDSLRVLAADDNPVNREVLNEALLTLGIKAKLFEAAEPLLEAAPTAQPDVIFLDISMPSMDGITALQKLKKMGLERQPKIVALTAHVTTERQARLREHGFETVISKPFTLAQISNALREANQGYSASERPLDEFEDTDLPVWDSSILHSLEEATERTGFADRMIQLFRQNCVVGLQKLADAKCGGPEDTSKAAHALKSMASTIGALRIAAICQSIEDDPESFNGRRLELLGSTLELTLNELSAYQSKDNTIRLTKVGPD
ncbi:MAG: ATP-binding protein [Pseudomonadota bacterium]